MKSTNYTANNSLMQLFNTEKKIPISEIINPCIIIENKNLIRFELKRECYKWVQPDDIAIVMSNDHYVKALIKFRRQNKWMNRHCTIKELLDTLPHKDFIRLNKFYLLNLNHFSHINETEKTIYFKDGFSVPIPHRISRFILDAIKK